MKNEVKKEVMYRVGDCIIMKNPDTPVGFMGEEKYDTFFIDAKRDEFIRIGRCLSLAISKKIAVNANTNSAKNKKTIPYGW